MQKKIFGKIQNGQEAMLYTMENENGMVVKITNYGGTVVSILFPDKQGKAEEMILGFSTLDGYLQKENPCFGCIVGRFANRIAKGKFNLDGVEYNLAVNNGPNNLHGGFIGFDKVIWQSKELPNSESNCLELSYLSKDREEGFPGNLEVKVLYTLTNENELKIEYFAETDKATPINLTNHCYFNLTGNVKRDVLDHELKIDSNCYTPIDENEIPTGELKNVEGTAFDFREFKKIGRDISLTGCGYNHNYAVNINKSGVNKIAEAIEKDSKRKLEVYSSQIGLQLYIGNYLDGSLFGKEGKPYHKFYGLCLETQHFPDSPNQPNFPNCILRPGEKYIETTIYKFYMVQ